MIGLVKYHYRFDRSNQVVDWLLVAFSPRKAAISLYVYSGIPEHEYLLKDLGKYTIGKACIYVKKLSDISLKSLEKMMRATIDFLENKYGRNQ